MGADAFNCIPRFPAKILRIQHSAPCDASPYLTLYVCLTLTDLTSVVQRPPLPISDHQDKSQKLPGATNKASLSPSLLKHLYRSLLPHPLN